MSSTFRPDRISSSPDQSRRHSDELAKEAAAAAVAAASLAANNGAAAVDKCTKSSSRGCTCWLWPVCCCSACLMAARKAPRKSARALRQNKCNSLPFYASNNIRVRFVSALVQSIANATFGQHKLERERASYCYAPKGLTPSHSVKIVRDKLR